MSALVLPRVTVHDSNLEFEGYGSYQEPLWMFGMEEGFGGRLTRPGWSEQRELDIRATWPAITSARVACATLGDDYWNRRNYSRVWRNGGKLYRAMIEGAADYLDTNLAHEYVRDRLGQAGGGTFWGELFPLPAVGLEHWPYRARWLDRNVYRRALWWRRRQLWRARLHEHRPRLVICYGADVRSYAAELFGVRAQPGLYAEDVNGTRVVFAPFIGGRCSNKSLTAIVRAAVGH